MRTTYIRFMPEGRIQISFTPIKPVVMIEIFDAHCSRSLGQSGSIRTAINILNTLSAAGRLGTRPQARLCTYRGAIPRQEYTAACCDGKWRLQRTRRKPQCNPVPDIVRS